MGYKVELVEINRLPGNHRILLERGLALFTSLVHRHIDFLQFAAGCVIHHLRPGFIGFAQSHSVGVARPAIAPQSFVGQLGDMRSAHHDFHSGGANRIRDAVGLGDHPGHGADADQVNLLVAHILGDLRFIHGLGIAVNQQNLMARWSERLQQKHPEVRHEIARDPIVGVIKQNSHDSSLLGERMRFTARMRHERCQEMATSTYFEALRFRTQSNCTPAKNCGLRCHAESNESG